MFKGRHSSEKLSKPNDAPAQRVPSHASIYSLSRGPELAKSYCRGFYHQPIAHEEKRMCKALEDANLGAKLDALH